jgi:hypothetical protein
MTCSIAHHLVADTVDALGEPYRRQVCLVDLLKLSRGQFAVLRENFVDLLVQRRVVTGGVGVPDFVIARGRLLAQSLDLTEGDVRERHGAFVFVGLLGHRLTPVSQTFCRTSQDARPGRHAADSNDGIMGR